ncbi:E3 ubiquitin-protein ligase RHF2A [Carex littledalei]|uniref:RING-type E3 ubiquitin transferase n=1 Tax=Carex littledalei TaxID=544730 RepID=A0A833V9I2_9POAL|nr:E3 ubiquitin-protein ligase RHF2A [Carex littledalei]
MDEKLKMESHSSAAAFVQGGIQDACDDSCSICLEAFCDSDPSTLTSCKHEYHFQCILEWCQRSSQCPMCWQSISLKDPTSQELLEAVEQERNLRVNQQRTTAIFRHPMLGDFELQHLPVGADDAELEERIIQHLAAAAAMGRTHRIARRDGARGRSSGTHGRPHFLVFSTPPSGGSAGSIQSYSSSPGGENESIPATSASPSSLFATMGDESPVNENTPHGTVGHADDVTASRVLNSPGSVYSPGVQNNRTAGQTTPVSNDRAGPSDLNSFSESLKSRLQSVSTRYKESITKSTRGWRDRLFSRNSAIADLGSDVRNEVNAGIAAVSRMIERLETRENSPQPNKTAAPNTATAASAHSGNQTDVAHEADVDRVVSPINVSSSAVSGAGSSTSCAAAAGLK